MKHRALPIKKWIISELTPKAWSTVIVKALPELMQHNKDFNCFLIDKRTFWDKKEVEIIQSYLHNFFYITIPEDVLEKKSINAQLKNWLLKG